MKSRGRPRSDPAAVSKIAGRTASRRRAEQIKPAKPLVRHPAPIGNLVKFMRTLIPGYDPYRDAGDEFYYDAKAGCAAVRFFHEKLTHAKGELARQAFNLEPWQQAIVAAAFGWKRHSDGLRRYREVFIYVPKKNGKTPMAAGFVLLLLMEDGEPGAEIYGAALEYRQASLVWEHARMMVLQEPSLADRATIFKGQAKAIQLGEETGFATYRPIPYEPDSVEGFNTHGAVIDELHTHPDRDMVDILEQSTAARRQPMLVYITTADHERTGSICNEKHDHACAVRDGNLPDTSFLPVIFEATQDDDWTDRKVWRKANPNLGISVKRDFMDREFEKARSSPMRENQFKRRHLNMRTKQDTRWLSVDDWKDCACDLGDLTGLPCWAGLDLAATKDTTALVLVFRDGNLFRVLPFFWVPGENAHDREKLDGVPYMTWAKQGHLRLTDGNVTDFEVVRTGLLELAKRYNIRAVGFDPWNARHMAQRLQDEDGIKMVEFRQGFASMSEPARMLERMVLSKTIRHGRHPIMDWQVSHVSAKEDPAGNIKPDKEKSTERIDGVVALVEAIGMWMRDVQPKSVYSERGLFTI